MSNSSLVNYTQLSPNCTKPRNKKITKITIHYMAGDLSVETCGKVFANPERDASSNYGIGSDGRVGLYVDEANRSWCSSNAENDNQAVTIEVANDVIGGNWHVSDKALAKLIDLCVDICKRNDIEKLNFTGDKSGNLTMHKWFAATACPGEYLESKFPYIADEVNKRLAKGSTSSTPASSSSIVLKEGDRITLKKDTTYYNGVKIPDWVFNVPLYYRGKNKNGIIFSTVQTGAITGVVKPEYVNEYVPTITTTPVKKPAAPVKKPTAKPAIKVGSKVKLNKGAKTYTGASLAAFVYDREHIVSQIKGDRVVITYRGVVVAAVNKKDLTLV